MKKRVLNVGSGIEGIALPALFDGWQVLRLDIDPITKADIIADARELDKLELGLSDAVYCSHNLEHFYAHYVRRVLRGFLHVLNDEGFALLRVPDVGGLIRHLARNNLGLDAVIYESAAGPITALDMIYGYHKPIAASGNDFYAHKTGFTAESLGAALVGAGFDSAAITEGGWEIQGFAFKTARGYTLWESQQQASNRSK